MRKHNTIGQQGFTIIEMMIAALVFSLMIVIASAVVIGLTHNYRKGLVETSTQNVTRSIIDEVSHALQFSPASPSHVGNYWCVGSTKFTVITGQQLGDQSGQAASVLKEELGTGENCAGSGSANPQELVGTNMSLLNFNITTAGDVSTVTVRVAYYPATGAWSNYLTSNNASGACKGGLGQEFCAVRELSTTVQSRLY